MRKILLGTTALIGAALLAPEMAAAQQAPTVRIGGYFRAYYGYTNQTSPHITGTTPQGSVNLPTGPGAGDTFATPAAGSQTALATSSPQSTRTGKHDFSTDAEIHVFVNGKTANGLTYGAVVEIQFDNNEGQFRPARRSQTSKTMADIDEMYAFLASPTLGQVRFGDEDGPFGGLMNTGFVTNFGTGGVYGDWQDFVIRPNRTTTSPGDVGDNSKIIYLSPQFFGFDFGLSWAFNEGVGGSYMWGNTNFFYIPTQRGAKEMEQFFIGASYTAGPFTIGANTFWGTYDGTSGFTYNPVGGVGGRGVYSSAGQARISQRRNAYSVGANYRLAPGLDLVAEYVRHTIHEPGVDLDVQTNNGVQDKLRAHVLIVGTRLAF